MTAVETITREMDECAFNIWRTLDVGVIRLAEMRRARPLPTIQEQ